MINTGMKHTLKKNIAVLGATGSIGRQTLDVVRRIGGFNVVALACGNNLELLAEQAAEFQPRYLSYQNSNLSPSTRFSDE